MIPLYSLYTPSHRVLKERFFEPTLPNDVDLRLHYFENEGDGSIGGASFHRAVLRKVEVIIDAIRENWGRVFVWSDIDVQFFAPINDWVLAATHKCDIVFQIDAPGPSLCDGFFFCRGNEDTLRLWQDTLDVMIQKPSWDDQAAVREILWNGRQMRWGHLPPVFVGAGTFAGQLWEPGREFLVPKNVVAHHANFTCGVPNKIQQCEYVLEQLRRHNVISLEAACQPFGGTQKFAWPPSSVLKLNQELCPSSI